MNKLHSFSSYTYINIIYMDICYVIIMMEFHKLPSRKLCIALE